jgi:sugar phosphate permease
VKYQNLQSENGTSHSIALSDSTSTLPDASDSASLLSTTSGKHSLNQSDSLSESDAAFEPLPMKESFFDALARRIFPNPIVFMWFVSAFAAISGFLFGYDIGIIAGALLMMKEAFNLTKGQEEAVVSLVLVGSIAGSLGAGIMNDKLGRWKSILISNLAFFIGSGVITFSPVDTLVFVYIGRLIVGLAIGVLPLTSTLYIAELSEPKRRGTMVRWCDFSFDRISC